MWKKYYYVELPIEDNIIRNERKDGFFMYMRLQIFQKLRN